MNNLNDLKNEFLKFCEIEKNLSPYTLKMYDFCLSDFTAFLKDHFGKESVSINDISLENIKLYRINLNRRISKKSN